MALPILPTDPRFIDMTGRRCGDWLVLHVHDKRNGEYRWWCRCVCDKQKPVFGNTLRHAEANDRGGCGCIGSQRKSDSARAARIGQKYNMLTALRVSRESDTRVWWWCRCECGVEKEISGCNLGRTLSCGCVKPQANSDAHRTHGRSGTSEFRIWTHMIQRCTNPKNAAYKRYGGRGISVCRRWSGSFEAFVEDMGLRPTGDHSLDRMRVNDGYDCGKCEDCQFRGGTANCRWATASEQGGNRRNNVYIEHDGRRMTATEWARETGLKFYTIQARIQAGWTVSDALTRPAKQMRKAKAAKLVTESDPEVLAAAVTLRGVRDELRQRLGGRLACAVMEGAFGLAMLDLDDYQRVASPPEGGVNP